MPAFRFQPKPGIKTKTRPAPFAYAVLGAAWVSALGVLPDAASAHAIVVAARPAMNATEAPGDLPIRLEFNSRIDRQRSRISLRRPDGTEAVVALAPDDPPNVLSGSTDARVAGLWKLRWQVLSLDGHITRGEVSFSVAGEPQAH